MNNMAAITSSKSEYIQMTHHGKTCATAKKYFTTLHKLTNGILKGFGTPIA